MSTPPGLIKALSTTLPTTLSAVSALACAVALTSCSDSEGDSAGGTTDTVTITHAYGETEVPAHPSRALSFSRTWTDAFADLGSPVATQVVNEQFKDGVPWDLEKDRATEDSGGAATAGETVSVTVTSSDLVSALGLEAILAKEPDVIFAGYLPDQKTYDALTEIAPTVATVGSGKVDDWRTVTTAAGDILGLQDEARERINSVDTTIAAVKQTYPAVKGATFAYAAYRAQSFSVITSPEDASNAFLTDLGLVSAADQMSGTESARGVAVSAENIDMLDVDLLVLWITGETPDALPGWSDLKAVKRGSAAELDTIAATALAGPTVRSIPWILEQLDPYFAAL